jgi:2-(1,2-epoxy-1,2-dihydrophenyl)acetyl-CoA isomerase
MTAERNLVALELDEGVATIRFISPESGNAMNQEFFREFSEAVHELFLLRAEVRAVLIASTGRFFSVGGDVGEFAADPAAVPDLVQSGTYWMHPALARLRRLDAPLIAAVQGTAMGGAVAILSQCDLVISARSARFGAAYSRLGFSCDLGASVGLASRMGVARARRFLLLAEMLDADQALAAGLIDEIADDGDAEPMATERARTLADGPTRAYGEVRRLVDRALATPYEAQLEDEAQSLTRIAGTADAVEGLRAFVEKRPPHFVGN